MMRLRGAAERAAGRGQADRALLLPGSRPRTRWAGLSFLWRTSTCLGKGSSGESPRSGASCRRRGRTEAPSWGLGLRGAKCGELVKAAVRQRLMSLASPGPARAMRDTVTEQMAPGPYEATRLRACSVQPASSSRKKCPFRNEMVSHVTSQEEVKPLQNR